jgi:hypothetical protein
MCLEVTAQAWRRLSSIIDVTRGREAHRRVSIDEANEAVPRGAVDRDEERW